MAPVALRLAIAAAIVLVLTGGVMALASGNAVKRVAGAVLTYFGAVLALAAMAAPSGAMIAGLGLALVTLIIGAAIVVRLQETYGGVELIEIDQADARSERGERST